MKSTISLPFLMLLFLIPSVWSQEEKGNVTGSREEEWTAKRQEKLSQIVPEKLSTTERILLKIEKGGLRVRFKSIYPGIGNLGSGSGFAPQIRFWQRDFPIHFLDLQATAAYSTRSYQQYTFQIGRILQQGVEPLLGQGGTGGLSEFRGVRRRASTGFLYGDFAYRDFPQEDFFGIGPNSLEENRTDYAIKSRTYGVVAGYRFANIAVVGARAGLLKIDINEGTDDRFPNTEDLFNDDQAPGLLVQPDNYFRFNTAFVLDYREKPGNAHTGGMIGFSYTRFNDTDTNTFDFHRYTIDAKQFISLGSVQRVLALHFLSSFDDPDTGSRVPFYLQESLGGADTLRGFIEYRFRDVNRMLMQAEYRWEAAPALEFALFYDTGKVFADRDDFDFKNLEKDWGFGVRFKFPQALFLRIDIAKSNEATRFYFKFNSAF